jgi:hypothetical protein
MALKEKIQRGANILFPFVKPAKSVTQIPKEVAEITFDELKRLGARTVPRSPAPTSFTDAQQLFREAAARQSLDATRLAIIQTDLDRRWGAIFFMGVIAFAVGIAGLILLVIDGFFPAIGYASSLCVAGYATTSLLRTNLRRSQVRARALVSWPQFKRAAGGILPAIFGDIKLSADKVDGGK